MGNFAEVLNLVLCGRQVKQHGAPAALIHLVIECACVRMKQVVMATPSKLHCLRRPQVVAGYEIPDRSYVCVFHFRDLSLGWMSVNHYTAPFQTLHAGLDDSEEEDVLELLGDVKAPPGYLLAKSTRDCGESCSKTVDMQKYAKLPVGQPKGPQTMGVVPELKLNVQELLRIYSRPRHATKVPAEAQNTMPGGPELNL